MDTTKQLERFHQQLARSIEQQGYSYRNFSLSLGKSPNYISNILSGKSNPSLGMLMELSDALSMELPDLLGYSNDSFELMELIPKLRSLSSAELAFCSKMIDLINDEKK